MFEDRKLAGLGIVIRDESGMIIAALSQKIPLPSSMDMVEALASSEHLFSPKRSASSRPLWKGIP